MSATTAETALLEVDNLHKRFGGVLAVNGMSCTVHDGEIVGLIGPNGSGKTTTFNMIAGSERPDSGEVTFDSHRITGLTPHRVAGQGLIRTFQISRVFHDLTVAENLSVATSADAVDKQLPWELIDLVNLGPHIVERAGDLSFGQQKLLELIRAAALGPRLMLLDEPFAGVNETMERQLATLIRELQQRGVSFFLIDHEMKMIMSLCDRIYVMHQGALLFEGPPEAVRDDEATKEAYFGKGRIRRP